MVYDIKDKKAAYYHAPKCGSRTVLATASIIRGLVNFEKSDKRFDPFRRDLYHDLCGKVPLWENTQSDSQRKVKPISAVDCSFRFCFVRNPVERFISGFLNRVLFHQDCGKQLSWNEFIENFYSIYEKNERINTHFKPQTYFYGLNPKIFHKIYKMNEFNKMNDDLMEIYQLQLPKIHLHQSKEAFVSPTEDQISFIKDFYKEDYEVYGQYF